MSYTPVKAFMPSQAFLQYLDTIPLTPAAEKRRKDQEKAEELRLVAERAAKNRELELERERRLIAEAEARANRGPVKRGWQVPKKDKHVVVGRIHLMEDDDPNPHRASTQYSLNARFDIRNGHG
jgi:hypothetical protein